jgi:ElaB/YqjD/DUF883 family membrane-anchored ribosome-binding protein
MPAGEMGQPHRQEQGRQDGGSTGAGAHGGGGAQGVRDQARRLGQQAQEGMEQVRDRVREGYDSARDVMGRGYDRAEEIVTENPSEAVLIAFGVGFGLGLLLTMAMTRREETWVERHVPDRFRDLPDMIAERVAHYLPRSMK